MARNLTCYIGTSANRLIHSVCLNWTPRCGAPYMQDSTIADGTDNDVTCTDCKRIVARVLKQYKVDDDNLDNETLPGE